MGFAKLRVFGVTGSDAASPGETDSDQPMIDENGDAWEEAFDASEVKAMAQVFALTLSSGSGLTSLNASVHAHGGLLWQQKVKI